MILTGCKFTLGSVNWLCAFFVRRKTKSIVESIAFLSYFPKLTMNGSCAFSCFIVILSVISSGDARKLDHNRFKRFLIYPRQAPTRYQFISGIGIPADLTYESLVTGYVLKAMYYLPYNATVYRENPFLPEYPADNHIDQRKLHDLGSPIRWAVYKFLEDRLESYGYNGRECLLKSICEASGLQFDRQYNVFGELMNIILSPSTSKDQRSEITIDFFEAEKLGRSGDSSCRIYNCELALLNIISTVFETIK